MAFEPEALAIWSIVALATGGVIVRPWRLPEAVWAVAGAAALVLSGLLPWRSAIEGVVRGTDVYLFLIGMMGSCRMSGDIVLDRRREAKSIRR